MKQSERDFLQIIDTADEEIKELKARLSRLQATKRAALKLQKFYYPEINENENKD